MKCTHILILILVALSPFLGYCHQQKAIKLPKPIDMVERISKLYINHKETSPADELGMQNALAELLNADKLSNQVLAKLIEVWMYYTPPDFPTGRYIEPILFKNKQASLVAIDNRLKNKKKGDSESSGPYAALVILKQRLIESH